MSPPRGADGEPVRLDTDPILAAFDLIGRCGAKASELGYERDNVPVHRARWHASAEWNDVRVAVKAHKSPEAAAEALAARLLERATCTHCGRLIALEPEPDRCVWERVGPRWWRGCRGEVPEHQRLIESSGPRGELPVISAGSGKTEGG